MARALKTQTTAVANWEQEMERQAEIAAGMAASTGGTRFFSTRSGVLSFDGAPVPGNQMGVVILDWVLENVYYEGTFNPDEPAPPTCFAFGRDTTTLAPHEAVVEAGQAQHEECKGCPKNEFGTAERGRGKACRNVRRLALIPAGTIDVNNGRFDAFTDPEQFESASIGILKVAVTSSKGFDGFVRQITGALRRPLHGIFTRVRVVPDPKNQFMTTFELLAPVSANLWPVLMRRHAETAKEIEQPYPLTYDSVEPQRPAAPAGRGTPRNSVTPARRAKY